MEGPQPRPLSPKSIRSGSKFSQTFSRFKGIIRLPGARKPSANDQDVARSTRRDNKQLVHSPYSRRSMVLKAYMSQPTLGHGVSTHNGQPGDSDPESSSSSSPVERNCHSNAEFPPPRPSFHSEERPDDHRLHSRTQSLHDLSHDNVEGLGPRRTPPSHYTGRAVETPPTPATEGFSGRNRPSTGAESTGVLKPLTESLGRPGSKTRIKSRVEDEPPVPSIPVSLQPSRQPAVEFSMSTSTTSTVTATPKAKSQVNVSNYNPSRKISYDDLDVSRPTNIQHHATPSAPTAKTSSSSFKSSSGSSFVTAESHISSDNPSKVVSKMPSMPLEAEPPAESCRNIPAAPEPLSNQATPVTTRVLPSLKIPMPPRKFSLLSSGETARLSPSLVIRAPPLPILNLPKLATPTATSPENGSASAPRMSRGAGLSNMPALPRQGTGRGTGGHEEHDLEDDGEDDEGDEEGDTEDDSMHDHDARNISANTNASENRSSYELEPDLHSGSGSSSSSAFSSPDFRPLHDKPQLPPLNVASSPFAVRFPGFPSAPNAQTPTATTSFLAKGKNKMVIPMEDEGGGSTPSHMDRERQERYSDIRGGESHYFDNSHRTPQWSSLLASTNTREGNEQSVYPSPQPTPGGSRHSPSNPPSPLRTPRPEDYRPSHHHLVPPPLLPHPYSSNRNSVLNPQMGTAQSSHRPSIYKHASRSLIDLHAIAKREQVEQMVREGEEEQEKEMRRKSMRRNRDSTVGPKDNLHSIGLDTPSQANALKSLIEEASAEGMDKGTIVRQVGSDNLVPQETSVSATNASNGLGTSIKRKTLALGDSELWKDGEKRQNGTSSAPEYDAGPHPLRKRRSMPVFNETSAPPPYPTFAPHPSARFANHTIQPRDDEGKEELPGYSNAIYLKAILPRKMEFSAPGVQAKDRKWRRVLCILEGTMLKVFKCPSGPGGVSAIEQWWENKVGAGDVATHATLPGGPGSRSKATGNTSDRNLEEEKAMQHYQGPEPPTATVVVGQLRSQSQPHAAAASVPSTMKGKDHSYVPLSKSALNIAVHLLKPTGRHSRSQSHDEVEFPSPRSATGPSTRGSSFDISRSGTPAPSTLSSATLGSQSQSPIPSGSTPGTTPYGSEASIPRGSTSSSSSNLSPPTLHCLATSPSSTRSRFRSGTTSRSTLQASSSSSYQGKDHIPEPSPQDLIRIYSLQNAESGLGNDYVKRKNVIRVRLEGEQFLLQAPDVASVVEWIEGLQAATNVALDLDSRPMPRGPIFPRRRRRRRPQVPPISTSNGPAGASGTEATETYTPQSATAGQPALRRA